MLTQKGLRRDGEVLFFLFHSSFIMLPTIKAGSGSLRLRSFVLSNNLIHDGNADV